MLVFVFSKWFLELLNGFDLYFKHLISFIYFYTKNATVCNFLDDSKFTTINITLNQLHHSHPSSPLLSYKFSTHITPSRPTHPNSPQSLPKQPILPFILSFKTIAFTIRHQPSCPTLLINPFIVSSLFTLIHRNTPPNLFP